MDCPSIQQSLKSSAGAVVFTHSVSWGKLQINGQAIDVTSDGNKPLYLPRGQNALSYYAPPFPVLTCTISAPAAKNDTCPIYLDQKAIPAFQTFPGRIVNLEVTPDRLSATQRDALLRAVQQQLKTLSAQVTIQPGDHYSTPEGRYLTADRTFTMTLNYHVTADGLDLVVYGCCRSVRTYQRKSGQFPRRSVGTILTSMASQRRYSRDQQETAAKATPQWV